MSRRQAGGGDARARRLHRKQAAPQGRAHHEAPLTPPVQAGDAESNPPRPGGDPASPPVDPAERQAVVVTHVVPDTPWPPGVTGQVRYSGRGPAPDDRFERWEALEHLPAGGGPYSLTSVIHDIAPGAWNIGAELVPPIEGRHPSGTALPLAPAGWSWWRWSVFPTTAVPVRSRWAPLAPLARMPAVLPGAWAMLCLVATVLALAVLVRAGESLGLAPGNVLSVTFVAVAAGLVGGRAWYAYLHPSDRVLPGGWAVDGFLVVAAVAAIMAALIVGLPVGAYLDASAPALFFAVAVARVGCFVAGCCAGRITTSRWAVWSSDHRIGARRVPTQAFESLAGGVLAVLAAAALPVVGGTGLVFALGMGAYLLIRQLLLRWRAERRAYSWRRAAVARASHRTASVPARGGVMAQAGTSRDGGPGR